MLLGYLALLVIFGYLLVKATDHLVDEVRDIAQITKIGKFGLTAFLLAFATSLPELVVGVAAALEGRPILSLGNVLGSNIVNVSLVMGGVAIVGGSIRVVGEFLKKDLFSTFLAGSMPLLLLIDGELSRVDALVLLAVYVWYTYTVLAEKTEELAEYQEAESGFIHQLFLRLRHGEAKRHFAWLLFWVLVLLFSADMLVKTSVVLAGAMGIPIILIGLFFVAIGTSLPEFVFGLKANRSGETAMVYGNLLGSVVANSTLILGITALIQPIRLDGGFQPYLLATAAFVVLFGLFWVFVSTKRALERWEGVVLVLVYLLYAFFEFSRVNGYDVLEIFGRLTAPL
ncbi:sodium:calcium antiporter [Patescibacteria group bacterium]|nr:sodium:calcium antiporter [Patescibacteria group bacterium]